MRIGIISYHTSPLTPAGAGFSGGMNIFISQLYKRLSRRYHVDVFVHGNGRTVTQNNLRILYIPRSRYKSFAQQILDAHDQHPYALIHTHYWLSGIVGQYVHASTHAPWIHSFHTIEHLKGIMTDKHRIEAEHAILRKCDYIISPTYREQYELHKIHAQARVFVIPHGVDTSRFTPSPNGHKKLLFVGRVAPIKGLDVLITSMRLLRKDSELTVVGGPSKNEYIYDSIRSYARGLRVNFIGQVPHTSLHEFYRSSSIVIVPSFYESFGLVALEAMSSARPVIGFDDTGLVETVGEDAGILIKRNEKKLSQAIQYLLDNNNVSSDLGKSGRRKSLRFDWDLIADRYRAIYEEIIKA